MLGIGSASLVQIQAFVTAMVDGWYISAPVDDEEEMRVLALVFATAVDPREGYTVLEVMEAFVRGVMVGRENVAVWMGGRCDVDGKISTYLCSQC